MSQILKYGNSLCAEVFDNESDQSKVVRRYINPAVYIESSICNAPSPKGSSVSCTDIAKVVKVKTCACSVDKNSCPIHISSELQTPGIINNALKFTQSDSVVLSDKMLNSVTDSNSLSLQAESKRRPQTVQKTKIYKESSEDSNSPTASLSALDSSHQIIKNDSNEAFKKWIAEKNRQRKETEEQLRRAEEDEKRKHELMLERERESFARWLAMKKKEQTEQKTREKMLKEEEEFREASKEKKRLENELRYRLWLKKKEEDYLEKKLKEQMTLVAAAEEKKRRKDENSRAYERWYQSSKNKPKPIPMNKGLDSLRSSVSVTYINPTPWNAEEEEKPAST